MRYDNFTFMLSLPRSRSAWFTEFFRRGGVDLAMHDPMKQCASVAELREKIDTMLTPLKYPAPSVFIADTSLILAFDHLYQHFPDAKYLFIARQPEHVRASLLRQGIGFPPHIEDAYCRRMEQAVYASYARADLTYRLRYDMIDDRLLNLWRFVCGNIAYDFDHGERMKKNNIQIPFATQRAETDTNKLRQFYDSLNLGSTK
jgi:hypothetical protein